MLPKEMQSKIIVVTVGTAKVTPKDLCYESYNYASQLDLVHLGQDLYVRSLVALSDDIEQRLQLLQDLHEEKERLILLEPHPEAKGRDHDCESRTNDRVYSDHLQDYLQNNARLR
jgi:hypothetical protein